MERIENVKKTGFADEIIIEDHVGQKIEDIIKYDIDVFTVGSDWAGAFDHFKEYCEVVYLERTKGISSSQLRSNFNLLKLGIIGTGRIANRFIPEAKYVSGVNIESVYNPREESAKVFAKKHKLTKAKDLKNAKFKLEQSKARVDEIDRVLTKLYEDNALGKITDERFERLSATYEKEQRELADCIIESETEITEAEQDNVDLKHFLKTIRACTDLKELTPEIVNTLIKRINVHNAEKVDGRKKVKIDIEFIAVGLISIPDEKELLTLMEEIRNEKVA
jgi:hypothetical protein